jgi:hypothetical protein
MTEKTKRQPRRLVSALLLLLILFVVWVIIGVFFPESEGDLAATAFTLVMLASFATLVTGRFLANRVVAIGVLLILALLALSIVIPSETNTFTAPEREFALNITTEALGGVALIIVFLAGGRNLWTLAVIGGLALLAIYGSEVVTLWQSDLLMNFSSEMIGTIITILVLQRFQRDDDLV